MNHIDRKSIKLTAKGQIRSGRRSVMGMTAIFLVINFLISAVDYAFTYFEIPMAAFITILVSLISTVLGAGYILFCMGIRDGEEMPFSSLFDGFGFAGKIVWLNILMTLYIFLWMMLFIVPGFIAAYRYRFAMYNLLENPELSASQAIALSKIQTNGMKMQLFTLDLSFLGWSFVTVLTAGLLSIWLMPYIQFADLGYYEIGKQVISPFPRTENTFDDQNYSQF